MTCPHGMPSPASCLDCMEEGGLATAVAPEPPELRNSRVFPSKFDATCRVCDTDIFMGQEVVHTTRDRYVHAVCVTGSVDR